MSIGEHWLLIAYSRIKAGEKEKDVLLDYGYVENKDKQVTHWVIPHPGTGKLLKFKTFRKTLEYFEGHNIPRKVVNNKEELFKISINRMKKYLKEK